ncbi:MAG: ATP-binding cassette domain-containing protein [Bacteroidales bacterium]|nr:ATP-binding cassette domain-containing protein [Bacteroidales bacterium]
MKLISLKILSEFRNLNGVELKFNSQTNTYVLIGNNGAGKSSLLEAVSSIFFNLYQGGEPHFEFNFTLAYEYEGHEVEVSNSEEENVSLKVDGVVVDRNGFDSYLPQRVVCNYSGEEMRINERYYSPLWNQYEARLKDVAGLNPLRMVFVDKDLWRIILYIIIAQRNRYESFMSFLKDTIGIYSIDRIYFEINRAALDLWRENTVSYYMRELAGRIGPDGTLTLDQMNPNDDEALTMFNNLSSARLLIKHLNITFNGNVDSQYLSEGEKKLMVVLFILEVISDERSLVLLDEPDSHLHVAR